MILLVFATAKEREAMQRGSSRYRSLADGAWGGRCIRTEVIGVGPVNAALNMGMLLGRYTQISGVVCLGIGGTFSLNRYPLGSACIITGETWPEYGIAGPDRVHPQQIGFPLGEQDGAPIWDTVTLDPDRAAGEMHLSLDPSWARATGLTVAGVSATPGRAAFMRRTYDPGVENMEGFSLAYMS